MRMPTRLLMVNNTSHCVHLKRLQLIWPNTSSSSERFTFLLLKITHKLALPISWNAIRCLHEIEQILPRKPKDYYVLLLKSFKAAALCKGSKTIIIQLSDHFIPICCNREWIAIILLPSLPISPWSEDFLGLMIFLV